MESTVEPEDLSRILIAMKKEGFNEILEEYARDISDPTHREEKDNYLKQCHVHGELPKNQTLIQAQPGLCVKMHLRFTSQKSQHVFLNVGHHPQIPPIRFDRNQVSLPFALGTPHPDMINNKTCLTVDCGISPDSFAKLQENPDYVDMLVELCQDSLQSGYFQGKKEKLDRDYRVLKDIKCKGDTLRPLPVDVSKLLPEASPIKLDQNAPKVTLPSEIRRLKKEAQKADFEKFRTEELAKEAKLHKADPGEARVCGLQIPEFSIVEVTETAQHTDTLADTQFTRVVVTLRGVTQLSQIEVLVDGQEENVLIVEVPDIYYLELPFAGKIEVFEAKFLGEKEELQVCFRTALLHEVQSGPQTGYFDVPALKEVAADPIEGGLLEVEELPESQDHQPSSETELVSEVLPGLPEASEDPQMIIQENPVQPEVLPKVPRKFGGDFPKLSALLQTETTSTLVLEFGTSVGRTHLGLLSDRFRLTLLNPGPEFIDFRLNTQESKHGLAETRKNLVYLTFARREWELAELALEAVEEEEQPVMGPSQTARPPEAGPSECRNGQFFLFRNRGIYEVF